MKKNIWLVTGIALALSACNYSNQFAGTYNGQRASLSAYSKNIDKYCVALNLTVNGQVELSSYISAQSVFDPNDLFKPMSFNTKGADCSVNLSAYLVGSRTVQILATREVVSSTVLGPYLCQVVTHNQYDYQEMLQFQVRDNSTDKTVGNFTGLGEIGTYTDMNHIVREGAIYRCGGPNYPQPYPNPYPQPYPHPYPHYYPWPHHH